MTSKFLKIFQPFTRVLLESKKPEREVSFKEKIMWTAIALVIYLIMSQIPLYGIVSTSGSDPFYWMRVILASRRGSLTELGIGPIVTAGLIMQLLVGSKIIHVDMSDPEDRGAFTGAQKVLTILLTAFQAIAYIFGGAYGTPAQLGTGKMLIIFFQLIFATIIIVLLDEMLQKGWGLGSGVSLFIAANVAGQIAWNAFSFVPTSTSSGGDGLARGAIVAFFQSFTNPNVSTGSMFIRGGTSPSMLGVFTTIMIFMIIIYFESMRIEIPLSYTGYSGFKGKYPMKLMYVSNIPVILSQALYANVLFFAQLLAGPNASFRLNHPGLKDFLNLIGQFTTRTGSSQLIPVNGLAYYLTPPQGLASFITGTAGSNPALHAIIYLAIFITLCVFLGRIWVEVSGLAPKDIAGQILNSKMQIDGFRRSEKVVERILKRYIPTLTILNGMIIGFMSFSADLLGALGTGTGILLMVGIMHNYAETIAKEATAEQYPALRGFLGMQ